MLTPQFCLAFRPDGLDKRSCLEAAPIRHPTNLWAVTYSKIAQATITANARENT
jgi:hypothetical protein